MSPLPMPRRRPRFDSSLPAAPPRLDHAQSALRARALSTITIGAALCGTLALGGCTNSTKTERIPARETAPASTAGGASTTDALPSDVRDVTSSASRTDLGSASDARGRLATPEVPASTAASTGDDRAISEADALASFDETWEIVRRDHFDLDEANWDRARTDLRPRAAAARNENELRSVLSQLLARLGQSHFVVIPGEAVDAPVDADGGGAGRGGMNGFEARVVEDAAVIVRVSEDGPAARAGLSPGWEIVEVDGRDPMRQIRAIQSANAGRTVSTYELNAILDSRMQGGVGDSIELRARDLEGAERTIEFAREAPPGGAIQFGQLPPMQVEIESREIAGAEVQSLAPGAPSDLTAGYISFNIWMVPIMRPFAIAIDDLRGSDGMIIDLRGNPGGVGGLVMGIGGHFLEGRARLGTMKTRDDEMFFVTNPQRVSPKGEIVTPFAGPLAILVDESSASTSEIFAGGLQDIGRARIFGSTTAGAALPSMTKRLPNGDVLLHAVADFLVPSGNTLEGIGVIPDEPITLDRAALASGTDPVLAAAVQWIADRRVESDAENAEK